MIGCLRVLVIIRVTGCLWCVCRFDYGLSVGFLIAVRGCWWFLGFCGLV